MLPGALKVTVRHYNNKYEKKNIIIIILINKKNNSYVRQQKKETSANNCLHSPSSRKKMATLTLHLISSTSICF